MPQFKQQFREGFLGDLDIFWPPFDVFTVGLNFEVK